MAVRSTRYCDVIPNTTVEHDSPQLRITIPAAASPTGRSITHTLDASPQGVRKVEDMVSAAERAMQNAVRPLLALVPDSVITASQTGPAPTPMARTVQRRQPNRAGRGPGAAHQGSTDTGNVSEAPDPTIGDVL